MRLLHVTHQYSPAIGGAEKYIALLSEELARRGHTVDVLTTRALDYSTWANALPREERINGVSVRRFDSFARTPAAWAMMALGFGAYWPRMQRRYEPLIYLGSGPVSPGLWAAVRWESHRYDAIHINQLHYSHAWTAFVAARAARRPIILTPHIHAEQRETWNIGYLRAVLRGSHVLIADSAAEQRHLLSLNLNSIVLSAGVGLDLDAYPARDAAAARQSLGLPPDAFVILFLGRKTHYKGLDLTVEAFARLRGRHPGAVLLALGPDTEFSEALWRRAGALDGVIRRGAITDEAKLDALAACDVMCMPSTGEAFGITYLEAWAYAKPVIGARIASVSTIVTDGVDGLLIEPGNMEELAAHMETLITRPDLASALGARGHQTLLRRYTVGRIAEIVEGACAIARRRAAA